MRGFGLHLRIGLTLYIRNRMALVYGYLFPTVFLLAFWVLYRYERVPLVRHMGELLTVTILGGACFGLATTLVSERERGVWRRFKLVPVHTGTLVVSTIIGRYVLMLSAGLLQLALARAVGMPWPLHPVDLFVAFTFASFAFLGVGLVLAMLADNVPAVQQLGQSIFLPMLILGGVAVPITALPEWAQQVSAFFPGRYAVEAIQATVNGTGLASVGFSLVALACIGVASLVTTAGIFRWDREQRFMTSGGKGWLALALGSWVAVGAYAVQSGYAELVETTPSVTTVSPPSAPSPATSGTTAAPVVTSPVVPQEGPSAGLQGATPVPPPTSRTTESRATGSSALATTPPPATTQAPTTALPPSPAPSSLPAPVPATSPAPTPGPSTADGGWRAVRLAQLDEELVFTRLPPDGGVVTPIAGMNDPVDNDTAAELETFRVALQTWAPGKVPDLEQRVRNLLYIPAVIDVFQYPTESLVPLYVFEQIQQEIPNRDDLLRILYWIAVHPDEGSDSAVDQMRPLGVLNGPSDIQEVRGRLGTYAVKLIGRITGKRPAR